MNTRRILGNNFGWVNIIPQDPKSPSYVPGMYGNSVIRPGGKEDGTIWQYNDGQKQDAKVYSGGKGDRRVLAGDNTDTFTLTGPGWSLVVDPNTKQPEFIIDEASNIGGYVYQNKDGAEIMVSGGAEAVDDHGKAIGPKQETKANNKPAKDKGHILKDGYRDVDTPGGEFYIGKGDAKDYGATKGSRNDANNGKENKLHITNKDGMKNFKGVVETDEGKKDSIKFEGEGWTKQKGYTDQETGRKGTRYTDKKGNDVLVTGGAEDKDVKTKDEHKPGKPKGKDKHDETKGKDKHDETKGKDKHDEAKGKDKHDETKGKDKHDETKGKDKHDETKGKDKHDETKGKDKHDETKGKDKHDEAKGKKDDKPNGKTTHILDKDYKLEKFSGEGTIGVGEDTDDASKKGLFYDMKNKSTEHITVTNKDGLKNHREILKTDDKDIIKFQDKDWKKTEDVTDEESLKRHKKDPKAEVYKGDLYEDKKGNKILVTGDGRKNVKVNGDTAKDKPKHDDKLTEKQRKDVDKAVEGVSNIPFPVVKGKDKSGETKGKDSKEGRSNKRDELELFDDTKGRALLGVAVGQQPLWGHKPVNLNEALTNISKLKTDDKFWNYGSDRTRISTDERQKYIDAAKELLSNPKLITLIGDKNGNIKPGTIHDYLEENDNIT
jgi:hypothetical protein